MVLDCRVPRWTSALAMQICSNNFHFIPDTDTCPCSWIFTGSLVSSSSFPLSWKGTPFSQTRKKQLSHIHYSFTIVPSVPKCLMILNLFFPLKKSRDEARAIKQRIGQLLCMWQTQAQSLVSPIWYFKHHLELFLNTEPIITPEHFQVWLQNKNKGKKTKENLNRGRWHK